MDTSPAIRRCHAYGIVQGRLLHAYATPLIFNWDVIMIDVAMYVIMIDVVMCVIMIDVVMYVIMIDVVMYVIMRDVVMYVIMKHLSS